MKLGCFQILNCRKPHFFLVEHENNAEKFMTDELSQLISSKNSSDLNENDNSALPMNSETSGTTLWLYFKKMSENKCKITPDSTS